ncbi:MAG: hypothetical protein UV60_C0005G0019 [Parcubacteria group bacterium GW2011_GWA2_43_11]|nr:MAG: hypothetical protein UU89_C0004G0018 [Parcubacteria group bacterium GW2011_GWC2_42_11]KKS85829.1 MAG: hypothetical protein UV60_C0005G0019 [Parcubacteria group bacterium GW2011_GWA2_43_11]
MPTISKEVVIAANKGTTKPLLRVLFVFSLFGTGVIVYTGYLFFTEGNNLFGACILSCGLLYFLYKIWRHFYNVIIEREIIVIKIKENLYYGDIRRSMNGEEPRNVKIV